VPQKAHMQVIIVDNPTALHPANEGFFIAVLRNFKSITFITLA